MKGIGVTGIFMFLVCFGLVFSVAACSTTSGDVETGVVITHDPEPKGGPPPHAPAHGYRAKQSYRYYPNAEVYYDESREVYFYIESGSWRVSVALPSEIEVMLDEYVIIVMDSDTPYKDFKKHKKDFPKMKSPPGQAKVKKNFRPSKRR